MWRRIISLPYQQQQVPGRRSHSSSLSKYSDSFDYCVNLVRQRDRESYVCTLLLPPETRPYAFAIRAFNVELSTVPSMVSNPNTALMRFQFWSSTLEKIFNASRHSIDSKSVPGSDQASMVPEHPVAQALAFAVRDKQLSRKWLSELIDGRIDRLDERRAFGTIKELEDFYQRVFTSIFFLLLECVSVRHVNADHAASHLGKALGLVNGLRSIGAFPEQNVKFLPLELLVRHRISQQDVIRLAALKRRGRTIEGGENLQSRLRDLTYDLASQAHVHLDHTRQIITSSSKSMKSKNQKDGYNNYLVRLVLLPSVIADHYLRVLRKVDFDIFNIQFNSPYHGLPLMLWWRKITRTF